MEILVLLMIFVLFGVIGIVFVKIFPERVNKKQAQCSQSLFKILATYVFLANFPANCVKRT